MANEEHLEILKQGVEAWNQWRAENPGVEANLRGENLNRADLSGADLSRADLFQADLGGAKLIGAGLSEASLLAAMLQRQIEATDRQIDRLVYQLYNLTEAEIEIVEGQ